MQIIDEPRAYRDESDLQAMRRILAEGRATAGPAYYVHIGDLNWWLFYSDTADDFRRRTFLWPADPGAEVMGWAFLSPTYGTFDVFAHPSVADQRRVRWFDWAEGHLAAMLRPQGRMRLSTIWISEHDRVAIGHLRSRGFRQSQEGLLFLVRPLAALGAGPPLPPGYEVRGVAGEHEADRRAAASHAAFGSSRPLEPYVARYLRFMRSPAYDPELDVVAVAPGGQVAAFCICWLDEVNRVGHFEPVGTHPAFRQRGLGKAVLWEGLRRLAARSMRAATVCVEVGNAAARHLYGAVGLQPAHALLTFVKEGTNHA